MNEPTSIHAAARYGRETSGYADRVAAAAARLASAARMHEGKIVQASSFGAEDQVVTDLIARHRLPIDVATLDTGRLHDETLALMARTRARYAIDVDVYAPAVESVIAFVTHHNDAAIRGSVGVRKACCALRKTEPLERMLEGRRAWVTGLRREQSDDRGHVDFESVDGKGRVKFSPLADWSWADVWHYIAVHDVPYNELHDRHYPSIGCAPCTRSIAAGEDLRAGRWWWERGAKECGLHVDAKATSEAAA